LHYNLICRFLVWQFLRCLQLLLLLLLLLLL
jgi:hypothetical protein